MHLLWLWSAAALRRMRTITLEREATSSGRIAIWIIGLANQLVRCWADPTWVPDAYRPLCRVPLGQEGGSWFPRTPFSTIMGANEGHLGNVGSMKLEAAVRQAEASLMSKANVTGVGIGERDGKSVIKVFVSRKLPKSQLSADDIVPAKVAGYPTDVEEIGVISAESESP
jgi:hypothetical protein